MPEHTRAVRRRLLGKKCQLCDSEDWDVGLYLGEIRIFRRGSILDGDGVYPCVVVHCGTCGNTLLLNAIVLGIVEQESEAKDA